MTWTWVEPFAGAAACALRLVGGRDVAPPVAWMGGKRRLAGAILGAMGVPAERPARVLLADAGPWGWVWPLLLRHESAAEVARVLRSWSGEHPRVLWQRLAACPPAEDLHERAAQWLWLQARSASGVPIWWDGWRFKVDGRNEPQSTWGFGEDNAGRWRFAGRPDRVQEDRPAGMAGMWKASDGRGVERPAGARAVGGRWEKGNEGRVQPAGKGQRGVATRTGGMVNPGTIADRIELIARAFEGLEVQVHHGDAHAQADAHVGPRRPWWSGREECDCIDCDGVWCVWCLEHHGRRLCPVEQELKASAPRVLLGATFAYLDPPYIDATGYGWDMPRTEVLELAQRWAGAGAVVAVSESVPLELAGWHHLELTLPGGKPEWLTLSRPAARVPERQLALFEGRA